MKFAAELTPSIARKILLFNSSGLLGHLPDRVTEKAQEDRITLDSKFTDVIQNVVDHKFRSIVVLKTSDITDFIAALRTETTDEISIFSGTKRSGIEDVKLVSFKNADKISVNNDHINIMLYDTGDFDYRAIKMITSTSKVILITELSRAQMAYKYLYGSSNTLIATPKYWDISKSDNKDILASFSVNYC